MSKFNMDNVVGLVGITAGLVGIGFALGTHSKMAKISENLERSIDDLANEMPVDIPKDMIERAIEKAVANEVKSAVGKATDDVKYIMKTDIHKQVTDAVESEYSRIKETVLDELVTEAAKIDAKKVREDIERAAKKQVMDKLDEDLDDILDDFEDKLDDYMEDCKDQVAKVTKIYKSFSELATPSNGTVLRIG